MPTKDTDYNCHIKAYLTNHNVGSISRHIMPLVTDIRRQKQLQETRQVPAFGQRAPSLKDILNVY